MYKLACIGLHVCNVHTLTASLYLNMFEAGKETEIVLIFADLGYGLFVPSFQSRLACDTGTSTRSSGQAKTILHGAVQGGRQIGKERKRWEDNIKEWPGLEWNIILRKAENLEEWRKVVVKSTVVPQLSARLRDGKDKKKKMLVI